MTILDALVWLVIAKIAVMVFEDLTSAAKGRRSPRLAARDERRAAASRDRGNAPTTAPGRIRAALGGYTAGLVEDATNAARAHRRRKIARKRGKRAIDNVFVDCEPDDGLFYADCDRCGWTSRPYRIEALARLAGAEHATAHREPDEQAQAHPTRRDDDQPTNPTPRRVPRPRRTSPDQPAPQPWTPTVIPGGATNTTKPPAPTPPGPATETPTPEDLATTQEDLDTIRASLLPVAIRAFQMFGRCRYPMPGQPGDMCGQPVHETTHHTGPPGWPGNPHCAYHTATAMGPGTTDTQPIQIDPREITMINAEATGPEEIRGAFATAIDAANERSEEIGGIAGVLGEVADRYESLRMAPTTVGHLRDAAEQFTAAEAALVAATEELQAALSDFEARDGHVAEAAADAGNLASSEVLLG